MERNDNGNGKMVPRRDLQARLDITSMTSPLRAGIRVLVVDDSPICRKVVQQILICCEYIVTTSDSGEAALALLRERRHDFDIVVTDIHMPNMDGLTLLERIRLEIDLPVVLLSADTQPSMIMRGLREGAVFYYTKPAKIEEMRHIWQHVVWWKGMRAGPDPTVDQSTAGSANHQGGGGSRLINIEEDDAEECTSKMEVENVENNKNNNKKSSSVKSKRKHMNDFKEDEAETPGRHKRSRVVWDNDLHDKFLKALKWIGYDRAVPKTIHGIMKVEGLSRENVASHLQKFRLYIRKQEQTARDKATVKPPEKKKEPAGKRNTPKHHNYVASFEAYLAAKEKADALNNNASSGPAPNSGNSTTANPHPNGTFLFGSSSNSRTADQENQVRPPISGSYLLGGNNTTHVVPEKPLNQQQSAGTGSRTSPGFGPFSPGTGFNVTRPRSARNQGRPLVSMANGVFTLTNPALSNNNPPRRHTVYDVGLPSTPNLTGPSSNLNGVFSQMDLNKTSATGLLSQMERRMQQTRINSTGGVFLQAADGLQRSTTNSNGMNINSGRGISTMMDQNTQMNSSRSQEVLLPVQVGHVRNINAQHDQVQRQENTNYQVSSQQGVLMVPQMNRQMNSNGVILPQMEVQQMNYGSTHQQMDQVQVNAQGLLHQMEMQNMNSMANTGLLNSSGAGASPFNSFQGPSLQRPNGTTTTTPSQMFHQDHLNLGGGMINIATQGINIVNQQLGSTVFHQDHHINLGGGVNVAAQGVGNLQPQGSTNFHQGHFNLGGGINNIASQSVVNQVPVCSPVFQYDHNNVNAADQGVLVNQPALDSTAFSNLPTYPGWVTQQGINIAGNFSASLDDQVQPAVLSSNTSPALFGQLGTNTNEVPPADNQWGDSTFSVEDLLREQDAFDQTAIVPPVFGLDSLKENITNEISNLNLSGWDHQMGGPAADQSGHEEAFPADSFSQMLRQDLEQVTGTQIDDYMTETIPSRFTDDDIRDITAKQDGRQGKEKSG
ncbi:hypothetical protein H6P81_018804 [Aristolochia fimbriata]|uniref:Response regulatory domain-containing protein n=1 Tax=Aristolochia fimbriata TaxID=158543 RepID=A0AAV7E215_ARIFI|nr:hypothetical protein H6P81_018804 [Aristolochia fimbriata]